MVNEQRQGSLVEEGIDSNEREYTHGYNVAAKAHYQKILNH